MKVVETKVSMGFSFSLMLKSSSVTESCRQSERFLTRWRLRADGGVPWAHPCNVLIGILHLLASSERERSLALISRFITWCSLISIILHFDVHAIIGPARFNGSNDIFGTSNEFTSLRRNELSVPRTILIEPLDCGVRAWSIKESDWSMDIRS